MSKVALAIDIGATSGRFVIGHFQGEKLTTKILYRFNNYLKKKDGKLYWQIEKLEREIINGLKVCRRKKIIPDTLSIDTFGVDYLALKGSEKSNVFSYRDDRTITAKALLNDVYSDEELYFMTGIIPHQFNTIFQLYDDKLNERLLGVDHILFLPAYLLYFLTGKMSTELSILSTSGIFEIDKLTFNKKLLNILEIDEKTFPSLIKPGSHIGNLLPSISNEVGFQTKVKMTYLHDTAAAIYGANISENEIFISSGTWSIIGTLLKEPIITKETFDTGFSNELSEKGVIRFLKNIMGMWIFNNVRMELDPTLSANDAKKLAYEGMDFITPFNVTSSVFLNPKSMVTSIKNEYIKMGCRPPKTSAQFYFAIFNSLAISYAKAIDEIEKITNKTYKIVKVLGGGSKNELLNALTAKHSKKTVLPTIVEATAVGNILKQLKGESL